MKLKTVIKKLVREEIRSRQTINESANWHEYMHLADLVARYILGDRQTSLMQLKQFKGVQYNGSDVDSGEYNATYSRFVDKLAKLIKSELDWVVENNNQKGNAMKESNTSNMWIRFKRLQDRLHSSEFSLRALLTQGKIDDKTFNNLMNNLNSAIEKIEKTAKV